MACACYHLRHRPGRLLWFGCSGEAPGGARALSSATASAPPRLLGGPGGVGGGGDVHKYANNPTKYWDQFYRRHDNKFFKDRHYLEKDWGHYFSVPGEEDGSFAAPKVVLEVGCGAGNSVFPLLATFPNAFLHACDISPHAISLIKSNGAFRHERVNAFVCDVTVENLCKKVARSSVDVATLEKLERKNQMISENFYARGDGTCVFYFSEDSLSRLFKENGFSTLEVNVYCRQIENRSRKIVMDRRWIHAVFCSSDIHDIHQTSDQRAS